MDTILISCDPISCLISNRNGSKQFAATQKKGLSKISTKEKKPLLPLKLRSSTILIQSAVGVFALGFVDAGYSGDWSRIGVISRGTEDLLKAAAFVAVPFCIFLVFSLSKEE